MKIKANQLIFNKYKTKKLINQSRFSVVYEGINLKNDESVAIKFEERNKEHLLEAESFFLLNLKGFGIPKVISFGKNKFYNILIEEFLGPSLYHLWDFTNFTKQSDMKVYNVCMIALQALDRLEYIHSKNIIHRDIKSSNFLIGRNNNEIIYLIDFGFARKYKSSRTGNHIKFSNIRWVFGSTLYCSINANKGYEQSRRDDLESLGYMLVYLALNYLPWSNFFFNTTLNPESKTKKLSCLKSSITPESLCKGLPEEFASFIKYCRKLEFEKEPDYDYLKSLFKNILSRNPLKNELFFFWTIKRPINRKQSRSAEISGHYKRKSNSIKRIYNQIKNSLEKNKKNEKKNPNDNKLISEHRDTITVNNIDIKDYKNENSNIIIIKKDDNSFNDSNNMNNKKINNLLKLNIQEKRNIKEKKNLKKIIHRNKLINNDQIKNSIIKATINKNNNFSIIFNNNMRKYNFVNINNRISSDKSLDINELNNEINNNLNDLFKTKKNPNKSRARNSLNDNICNIYNSNIIYRTVKERESLKEQFRKELFKKKFKEFRINNKVYKTPSYIGFNETYNYNKCLFQKNTNISLPTFINYNNYDKGLDDKIEGNSFISSTNQNRNIYFKNNLVNNKYIGKK